MGFPRKAHPSTLPRLKAALISFSIALKGMIDSSGLRLYYTKRLRKYDAGMLYVGAAVDQSMMIPPKEKSWEFNGFCSEECTKEVCCLNFKPLIV